MKKLLLIVCSLVFVGCSVDKNNQDYVNSLHGQGYKVCAIGAINQSGSRDAYIIKDTVNNKIYYTTFNGVTARQSIVNEVVFK